MKMRESQSAELHDRIQAMLPWYVNDTLDVRDRAEVHAHLQHCEACRRESTLQSLVRDQVRRGAQLHPAPAASLDTLMARIERHEAATLQRWRRSFSAWLRGGALERAVIAQAATILLLVGVVAWLVIRPEPPAEYRTLGSPPAVRADGGPYLRLVLRDSLTAAQVQGLLQQVNGKIVDGPSAQGVYLVELGAGRTGEEGTPAERAAWLSEQTGVLLAVPVAQPERR